MQQEIEDGLVVEICPSEEAEMRFVNKLAIGNLGIASQQQDKPRLVLGSSIRSQPNATTSSSREV